MIRKIRDYLSQEGFQTVDDLNIGVVSADLYAELRRNLFLYPYFVHCYVFFDSGEQPVKLEQVVAYHALATAYTEVFKNKRTRWLRIRVPVTISIIISACGFDDDAIENVRHKQRYQMGHANTVSLIDAKENKLHLLPRAGLVGVLPLAYANKLTKKIARYCGVIAGPA